MKLCTVVGKLCGYAGGGYHKRNGKKAWVARCQKVGWRIEAAPDKCVRRIK